MPSIFRMPSKALEGDGKQSKIYICWQGGAEHGKGSGLKTISGRTIPYTKTVQGQLYL